MFAEDFGQILENLKVDDVVMLKGKFVSFQGNVISINSQDELFELYVTHSNDEEVIGEVVPIDKKCLSAIFESLEIKRYERTRADILSLIDFTLMIKDEQWFKEVCNELVEYDKKKKFIKSRKIS